jgi:hypothetical protein
MLFLILHKLLHYYYFTTTPELNASVPVLLLHLHYIEEKSIYLQFLQMKRILSPQAFFIVNCEF